MTKADSTPTDLDMHARNAAKENLPATDATEPNAAETWILTEAEREHGELAELTRNSVDQLTGEFSALESTLSTARDLAAVVEDADAAIEHELAIEHGIAPRRREQQLRRRVLRAFMDLHRIARLPQHVGSLRHQLGVLTMLMLAEAGLNCAFFASVSPLGLVGGYLLAVGVAAANFLIGGSAGYWLFRPLVGTRGVRRALAAVGCLAYVVLCVGLNLGIARYRDLATGDAFSQHLSFAVLLSHPNDLSFLSAILLVLGVIGSALSAQKSFAIDDPFPGFSRLYRDFVAADVALRDATEDLRARVLGHMAAVPGLLRAVVRRNDTDVNTLHGIHAQARGEQEAYEVGRARAGRWYLRTLGRYRDINFLTRTTDPPAYFKTFHDFPPEVDFDPVDQLSTRYTSATEGLELLKLSAHVLLHSQTERVRAVAARLDRHLAGQFQLADAGRGDGSEVPRSAPRSGWRAQA